jgi:TusA-related sulfurtransferase
VHLETLGRGTEIHLLVDDPQGARDIPRAAEAAGYHLIGVDADDGTWCIRLEV